MKKEISGLVISILILIFMLVTVDISEADYQGTIGTRFTITDSGFGLKKPKVYIQYEKQPGVVKKVHAKVESWSDTDITCVWKRRISPGTYDLWVKPNMKDTSPISAGTFTIMPPAIDDINPQPLTPGARITINGKFFTNKKPKVYLIDLETQKRKRCRVVSSTMDSSTGASSLDFIMPKEGSGMYEIDLKNLVAQISFTPDPLNRWHWRNPLPQGNTLSEVAYGKGIFVTVGNFGTILTSPDGVTWAPISSGTIENLHGVIYGKKTFVAVGENGLILTSPDGVAWTSIKSGTSNRLNNIRYIKDIFVVVGDAGTILTSSDGMNWKTKDSGTTYNLNGITFGNDIFVAVGGITEIVPCGRANFCPAYYQVVLTSVDGEIWESSFSGNAPTLTDVTYGKGTFVAVGYLGKIFTSPDGVVWTTQTSGIYYSLCGVCYDNDSFVAVGEGPWTDSGRTGTILTSDDGESWTQRFSGSSYLRGVTYGKGTFIAIGYFGAILTSHDKLSWTSRRSGTITGIGSVIYVNGTFVASGNDGIILTSPDGLEWETNSSSMVAGLYDVAYGNGLFVAYGYSSLDDYNGTVLLISPDGVQWTVVNPEATVWLDVTYGNGIFVAIGDDNTIWSSYDGVSWTPNTEFSTVTLRRVAFGNGTFVILCNLGQILTSTDGTTWVLRNSDIPYYTYGKYLTFGNGVFVATGLNPSNSNTDVIMSSPDGLSWQPNSIGMFRLRGLTFGNGTFMVAATSDSCNGFSGSVILTSPDGVEWTSRKAGSDNNILSITYGNSTFVAVGEDGTIIQSDPLW